MRVEGHGGTEARLGRVARRGGLCERGREVRCVRLGAVLRGLGLLQCCGCCCALVTCACSLGTRGLQLCQCRVLWAVLVRVKRCWKK